MRKEKLSRLIVALERFPYFIGLEPRSPEASKNVGEFGKLLEITLRISSVVGAPVHDV